MNGNRQQIYRLYNYIAVSFLYAAVAPPADSIIGPIVGVTVGSIGGVLVCFTVLVLVVALIVRRKRKNLSTETNENQKATASPLYDEITTIATDIQLESNSAYGQVRKMSPLNE